MMDRRRLQGHASYRFAACAAALFAAAGGAASVSAFVPPPAAPRVGPAPILLRSCPGPAIAAGKNVRSRSRRHRPLLSLSASVVPVDGGEGSVANGDSSAVTIDGARGKNKKSLWSRWKSNAASATANRKMLRENAFAILAGLCLSFNAGYVNGACMSGLLHSAGSKVSVAGFTGAYTNAGLALATGNWESLRFFSKMIASFAGGATLSGLLNPRPVPHRMGPTYGPTFLFGSVMLAISSVLSLRSAPCNSMFYFAAAANGLQNGMSSMYTANLVRSCHMSGTSTDIGMILGQMLGGNRENAWKALVLTGLAASFTGGGIASYWAVTKFRSLALAFNAAAFFAVGVGTVAYTSIQQRVSMWQAVSGQWKWKSDVPSEDTLMELFDRNAIAPSADVSDGGDDEGALDEEGLRTVLREAGMIVADVGVTAIFKMADTNEDGSISRDEFFGLIMCDVDGEECRII